MASETTAVQEGEVDETFDPHAEHEHAHPSDWTYVKVALFLAAVTGLEVGLYYIDMDTSVLVALLIPLMVIKFGGVVWYFMHLKFDSRLFSRIFVSGLILAVIVYLVTLSTFQFFG
ncbi:MAG: cytochrome C oxidase subunit IV family protein [Acidimicrobiales bacterium]